MPFSLGSATFRTHCRRRRGKHSSDGWVDGDGEKKTMELFHLFCCQSCSETSCSSDSFLPFFLFVFLFSLINVGFLLFWFLHFPYCSFARCCSCVVVLLASAAGGFRGGGARMVLNQNLHVATGLPWNDESRRHVL